MSDALLRLAHGGLAPARIDRILADTAPEDAVARIDRGGLRLPDAVRGAIRIAGGVRRSELAGLGVTWAASGSDAFPIRLVNRAHMPRWLFMRGEIRAMPTIAIVGTRTCTTYGTELAAAYGAAAAEQGWAVVSGLARGIDRAAHVGALGARGHAVAVLGSGIDVVYPRSNRDLHDEIVRTGGAVVSEYPPGTRPDGWRFPTRNRIIVGLSDVVLVVEAGETGGALITARIALDAGTPVYATPADVDRPASVGTNQLIRDGAFPVFDADDLRMVLSLVTPLVASAS